VDLRHGLREGFGTRVRLQRKDRRISEDSRELPGQEANVDDFRIFPETKKPSRKVRFS